MLYLYMYIYISNKHTCSVGTSSGSHYFVFLIFFIGFATSSNLNGSMRVFSMSFFPAAPQS